MSYSIQVTTNSATPKVLFLKEIKKEEFNIIDSYKSAKTFDFLQASLITVRTNSWENFRHDFLLPTVVNHALKTDQIGGKIIKGVFGLLLDLATFPVRLITLIPRVLYNNLHQKENHPLYKYFTVPIYILKTIQKSFFDGVDFPRVLVRGLYPYRSRICSTN